MYSMCTGMMVRGGGGGGAAFVITLRICVDQLWASYCTSVVHGGSSPCCLSTRQTVSQTTH